MKLIELLLEVDFDSLERKLDDLFDNLDIDINFTKHFKERVLQRNIKPEEVIDLANKIIDKYEDELAFMDKGDNAVLTHLTKLLDIAVVSGGYGEDYLKDLIFKTAYKRQDKSEPEFRTNKTSPKLKVSEEANNGTFSFFQTGKVHDEEDNSLISVEYTFETPNNKYRVEFYSGEYKPEDKIFDLSFGIDKGGLSKLDTFQMTGEGNARKIIYTIVKIIEDFTSKFDVSKVTASATSEKRRKIYKAIFNQLSSSSADKVEIEENFKDGKKKGKSRPGRVKKAGASCKGSVSSLRAKAKKYGGEKGKMYHWCANMKGGKKK